MPMKAMLKEEMSVTHVSTMSMKRYSVSAQKTLKERESTDCTALSISG